jgi:hypothetical protein
MKVLICQAIKESNSVCVFSPNRFIRKKKTKISFNVESYYAYIVKKEIINKLFSISCFGLGKTKHLFAFILK